MILFYEEPDECLEDEEPLSKRKQKPLTQETSLKEESEFHQSLDLMPKRHQPKIKAKKKMEKANFLRIRPLPVAHASVSPLYFQRNKRNHGRQRD
ncbi:MAG: hypothetical protein SPL08_01030 [Pseudomonadota bacterium]|nr:hypothetical protein [Pseudomonadota bacterium]